MQPTGINPGLIRILAQQAPDLLTELFVPGKVLDAEVVSVFGDRAILNLGRNLRLEAALQTPLKEGQKVKVQVQPPEQAAAQGEGRSAPIVLKLIAVQAPATTTVAPQPAQTSQAAPAPAMPVLLPVAPEAATQPQPAQPGQPQVLWLPIPLPQGGQAWTQVHVQEEAPGKGRRGAGPVHRVRIFWETPGLGPVQVTLDASATSLTALFTSAAAESRAAVDRHLPDLQQRLNAVGFPETRLGSRQPLAGETVEPVRTDEAGRLNLRM